MTASLDKELPPYNDQAEAGALASVLSAELGERLGMLDQLVLLDFYDVRHRIIFEALVKLRDAGKPLDAVTLHFHLQATGERESAGGAAYAGNLPDMTHSAAHFPSWLEQVKDFSRRRADLQESARLKLAALEGLPLNPGQPVVEEPDDKVLGRLAAFAPLEYERARDAAAKQLGCRTSLLDQLVAGRRTSGAGGELQGRALKLADVEPWPDPVDGAEVLSAVADRFTCYVALPNGAADASTLWTAGAHCFQLFDCSPRLNISSPEKGCGKTTLRDVVALIVPRPLATENLSVAVLFRVIESQKPTVLADECDAWLRDNEELRGMLNAGHRRGGQALRCEGESNDVRGFSVFAPVVLIGIGDLPPTLHDRSIRVRLQRAKPGELRERFDSRRTEREQVLCRKLARWCADNRERLAACDPVMPAGAVNRLADNWRPLFAIAEVAGGEWPQRAAVAFAALTSREDSDAQGIGVALLVDIHGIFADSGADKLPSAQIVASLASMEGREWAEFGRARKPISTNQLAKLLHRFEITPRTIKLPDGTTAKGYHLELFADAFASYLPPAPSQAVTNVTTLGNIDEIAHSEPSPAQNGLRFGKAVSVNKTGPGYGGYGSEAPMRAEKEALRL